MRCQGFQNQLTGYVEGELDRYQREAVERHLRVCANCRSELHSLTRTVALLREMPQRVPTPAIQNALAQKIRAVRQPMSFMERLRLRWQVDGLGMRTRNWAVGMAATVLLFSAASATRDRWQTRAEPLFVGIGISRPHAPVQNGQPVGAPRRVQPAGQAAGSVVGGGQQSDPTVVPSPAATGTAIDVCPHLPMVVGQQNYILFFVNPEENLRDAEVLLYPPAGITLLGNVQQQADASYLLRRGTVVRGDSQSQWVRIDVCPTLPGDHKLRVVVRQDGKVIAESLVPFQVLQASR